MGRIQHGYAFEREIAQSIKKLQDEGEEILFYKMIDTVAFDGMKIPCPYCGQWLNNPFIAPKALADYLVVHKGVTFFIECKSSKNKTSFPIKNIRMHQLRAGLSWHTVGTPYIFAVSHRATPRRYKCYCMTASTMDLLIAAVHPARSIKWKFFESSDNVTELERLKGGLWDMRPLINIAHNTKEEIK